LLIIQDTFRKFYANLIKNNPDLGKPKEEKNEAYMAGEASAFIVKIPVFFFF